MKKIGLALALSAAMTTTAMAEGMYFGAGVSQITPQVEKVSLGNAALGTVVIGTEFNDNFALEGLLGASLVDAEFGQDDDTLDTSVNYMFGVYGVAKAPILENLSVYAKLGWTKAEIDVSSSEDKSSDDFDDVSYGVGLSIDITSESFINMEYMSYIDKKDKFDGGEETNVSADAVGVSYMVRF